MGEVVNLWRARKGRAKAGVEAQAAANRAAFGRTKAEKANDRVERERGERKLDGVKLDR